MSETLPDDLPEFLCARYAEEVAEAEKQSSESKYDMDPWEIHKTAEQNYPCMDYLRIAKARVLAEVEAKRFILKEHPVTRDVFKEKPDGLHEFGCATCHQDDGMIGGYGWCATLRALALPYAGHPDYKEGWRL